MRFCSILFDSPSAASTGTAREAPDCFVDLHLDQIVASITAGRDAYNLKPYFYAPLRDVRSIDYRHEVFQDLENQSVLGCVGSFAAKLKSMRDHLQRANEAHYPLQKQRWFLDAAELYCDAVTGLKHDLTAAQLRSSGFQAVRGYLISYTQSEDFESLLAETRRLKADLSAIRYCLHIDGPRITVSQYASEPDYGADVLMTFERFKQGATKAYSFSSHSGPTMNHVEAAVLDLVAQLYPEVCSALGPYCERHRNFLDGAIGDFDREVHFYIAYREHVERCKRATLPFCYPEVSGRSKEIRGRDVFDLALANKLMSERATVVRNDFDLSGPERILVVTGANQGGKTTFARTFGQLHYLASIGCPVPGTQARLFLFDRLYTHFEREESLENQRGKLEDDLLRIRRILDRATGESILIMNESFLSTTPSDALFLSREIMRQVVERDMLCITVTFLDELASFGKSVVSMVSTVDPASPALRTFKIIRRPADGLAYAAAIAEKYGLGYESVKRRIAS
jgi:hypothetical protein